MPPIAVKFFPRTAAFENVVAQIKSGPVAYSLFALARLFLEKATRHDVKLTAPADSPMFQLGDAGAISTDRQFLERNAFRFAQDDLYKVEITETEPIKGNFTNVARDRFSGTVLGPTNVANLAFFFQVTLPAAADGAPVALSSVATPSGTR